MSKDANIQPLVANWKKTHVPTTESAYCRLLWLRENYRSVDACSQGYENERIQLSLGNKQCEMYSNTANCGRQLSFSTLPIEGSMSFMTLSTSSQPSPHSSFLGHKKDNANSSLSTNIACRRIYAFQFTW